VSPPHTQPHQQDHYHHDGYRNLHGDLYHHDGPVSYQASLHREVWPSEGEGGARCSYFTKNPPQKEVEFLQSIEEQLRKLIWSGRHPNI
jgi:hypothetical protein